MFTRALQVPTRSFFLFGPRGTGKTTWLRRVLPQARWFNLLLERDHLRLLRDPSLFRQEVEALPRGSWVIVDEVQRLPALLDQVHELLSRAPTRWKFALTGSSARKLRRAEANLLAGRLITRQMFALTSAELGFRPGLDDLLRFGGLPLVRTERSHDQRIDLLDAYVSTYLTQEIRAEALVRNLETFARFLEVVGLANAQVTNLAGIARDAGIARPTVQGHFEVLVDTLVGTFLPAFRPRAKVKETQHPKFYFFDPGVVRAVSGRVREPLDSEERGRLFETLVLAELRAQMSYASTGGALSYWRTPSGSEVDFVWSRGAFHLGIEVKAASRWRPEDGRVLKDLHASGVLRRCLAVYGGDVALQDGPVSVLPFREFTQELSAGRVLTPKRTVTKRVRGT